MKTLVFNLKEGNAISSTTLSIQNVHRLDSFFVDVANYIDNEGGNILIEFNHPRNSLLNVTEVSPYILLFFDKNRELKEVSLSIKSGTGHYTIITQYKYVLFVRMPHDLELNQIESFHFKKNKEDVLCKKYKYLNYIPSPVRLDPNTYDLADDEEFCRPDGRMPLLIATQDGIFPADTFKGKKDYSKLVGLENQTVGFIGRGYLSNRECETIKVFELTPNTLNAIRSKIIPVDLSLWAKD